MSIKRFITPIVIIFCIIFFFKPFFFNGFLPIPSDLVVGLFHPFRDSLASDYPRGVPYKNPLLTDPISQQIPWRDLVKRELSSGVLPLWNPYQMAGYPLLGNVQSAALYPFNAIFFLLPFSLAWSLLIISQPILAMFFMYFYLKELKLSRESSLLGGIVFAFSGFMISWLEWGTIGSTAMWLPLMLLSLHKLTYSANKKLPSLILCTSLIMAFLAGHTQTFFYEMLLFGSYLIALYSSKRISFKDMRASCVGLGLSFLLLAPIIWNQLRFISLSARMVDLDWHVQGWFMPWKHLIQFLAPNFFGNPATGNYWGVWNYGEFLGYVGILPILLVICALYSQRRKVVYFYAVAAVSSLIFILPNFISSIPFQINFPLLSSAQPTRLMFVIDFSLAVLAAFGLEKIFEKKRILIFSSFLILILLMGIFFFANHILSQSADTKSFWMIAQRNMIVPFILSFFGIVIALFARILPRYRRILPIIVIGITILDLFFVFQKFTPFTASSYFYPNSKITDFLRNETGINRVMSLDRKILHPNIPTLYRIQTIEGYDPLYLLRYGELLASAKRNNSDISTPFGFSRILTIDNYKNPITNLLGVKYILSLDEIDDPNLEKVIEDGQTKVYLNKLAFPRVFFVTSVKSGVSKKEAIDFLFKEKQLEKNAVVELDSIKSNYSSGIVAVKSYTPNKIVLQTTNKEEGFLVLTDSFYPTWEASIDDSKSKIYLTDFAFRGVIVPKGEHRVVFTNRIL